MPDSTDAREWVRYATSDLLIAETPPPSGVLLEHLCFHAQQATEKALKAVLVARGVVPPKTHDIAALVEQVAQNGTVLPGELMPITELTAFAVLSRYSADFGELDDDEWARNVALARAAVEWAAGVVG